MQSFVNHVCVFAALEVTSLYNNFMGKKRWIFSPRHHPSCLKPTFRVILDTRVVLMFSIVTIECAVPYYGASL